MDIIARMFATRLSEKFGEQFVVDNRPGAGSSTYRATELFRQMTKVDIVHVPYN